MDLFPDLPEDIAGLSDEDVTRLISEYQETADKVYNNEVPDLSLADRVAAMERGAELIDTLRVDRDRRAAEATALQAQLDEAAARAIPAGETPEAEAEPDTEPTAETEPETPAEPVADAEPDAPAEPAEPVADITPEPVADADPIAASVPAPRIRQLPRRRVKQPEPQRDGLAITAAADIDGYPAGGNMRGLGDVAVALGEKLRRLSSSGRANGRWGVATIHTRYPESRDLSNPNGIQDKIEAVTSIQAITASGGVCAPVENYYGLDMVSSTERPVRGAMASFGATRGGLNVAAVPTLGSIDDAVGIMTNADDTTGGTTATKTCQRIDCPDFTEVFLDAVYHCVEIGNMQSRAWPESVQNFTELVMAAHARAAEINLLDAISTNAATKTLTDAISVAGASGYTQVIGSFARTAAAFRSRHRMTLTAPIRILAPAWVRDLLISDLARSAFTARENAEALLNMELNALGINVTWYRDGATGKSQIFGAQDDNTALLDFPGTAYYYAYPEGGWLFLDGGTLELGVVRDSTLNSTNDYQIFGETFEQAAPIGVETYEVALTVCDTGAFSGTVAIPCSD